MPIARGGTKSKFFASSTSCQKLPALTQKLIVGKENQLAALQEQQEYSWQSQISSKQVHSVKSVNRPFNLDTFLSTNGGQQQMQLSRRHASPKNTLFMPEKRRSLSNGSVLRDTSCIIARIKANISSQETALCQPKVSSPAAKNDSDSVCYMKQASLR